MLAFISAFWLLIVFVVLSLVVLGIRAAARRANLEPREARRVVAVSATTIGAWLAVLTFGSFSGFLSDFGARPPRMLLVLGGSLALLASATRTTTFRRLLAATPTAWPIALQTMRVPIELGLWWLFLAGHMPEHMTFEGRNWDVLAGITAPFAAVAMARGWLGRRGAIAYNVLSLALLANVVGTAITTMPGPLQLAWPGVSNVIVAEVPFIFLPGFLVPVALLGHVASLRQLVIRRQRGDDDGFAVVAHVGTASPENDAARAR